MTSSSSLVKTLQQRDRHGNRKFGSKDPKPNYYFFLFECLTTRLGNLTTPLPSYSALGSTQSRMSICPVEQARRRRRGIFRRTSIPSLLLLLLLLLSCYFCPTSLAFCVRSPWSVSTTTACYYVGRSTIRTVASAQISQQEASKGIEKVVAALRQDRNANEELGRLDKVTKVLGYGSPTNGSLALRFNASFRKTGFGRSSVPLPFGLGQTNTPEGRGSMVGQVKATVDANTGKVTSCSVFRDLGYGRSFNLKV